MAGALKVGQRAPEFVLPNEDGEQVSLSALLERGPVMLVFYPGDFTPVCTVQLGSYGDRYAEFEAMGLKIIGISDDPVSLHKKFCDAKRLPFALLSDPTHRVIDLYSGASVLTRGRARRANYIVAKDGTILYAHVEAVAVFYRKAEAVLKAVRKLKRRGALD